MSKRVEKYYFSIPVILFNGKSAVLIKNIGSTKVLITVKKTSSFGRQRLKKYDISAVKKVVKKRRNTTTAIPFIPLFI